MRVIILITFTTTLLGIPANEMFRENKYSENEAKFRENAKCEIFAKFLMVLIVIYIFC